MLAKALHIAAEVFKDKTDKGGKPYFLHPLWVMNAVSHLGEEVMTIAILHDVPEDTHVKLPHLAEMGFSERVLKAVALLTHDKSVPYDDYIKALATNPDAKEVKKADLRHNSDITRLKNLRKKDFDRMEKYQRAYVYLSN